MTYYLFGLGISQLFYGPLSDRFGRRKVILFGFLIFIFSGFMCIASNSVSFLIFARFLSGIGAGAGASISRAIVSDIYRGKAISNAWSTITSSLMLSIMVAPVIGGYVEDSLGWRYNFILSECYSIIVFLILFFFYARNKLKIKSFISQSNSNH